MIKAVKRAAEWVRGYYDGWIWKYRIGIMAEQARDDMIANAVRRAACDPDQSAACPSPTYFHTVAMNAAAAAECPDLHGDGTDGKSTMSNAPRNLGEAVIARWQDEAAARPVRSPAVVPEPTHEVPVSVFLIDKGPVTPNGFTFDRGAATPGPPWVILRPPCYALAQSTGFVTEGLVVLRNPAGRELTAGDVFFLADAGKDGFSVKSRPDGGEVPDG